MSPPPTHDTRAARLWRKLYIGWGWCGRCGMPWPRAKEHITQYNWGSGIFPLCEKCWALLGHPEARIEYYGALLDEWGENCTPEQRQEIGRAVANGL